MTSTKRWLGRRLLAGTSTCLMAAALLLGSAPTPVQAATQSQLEQQLEKLEKEEKELKKQIQSSSTSLADSEKRKEALEKQVENAKAQLTLVNQQISQLDGQIADKNTAITQKETEIAEKEAEVEELRDQLSSQVAAMSKKTTFSNTLQLLLNSEEYADYLVTSKMLARIAERDQDTIDQMEVQIEEIQQAKEELEKEKQTINGEKNEVKALQAKATSKKSELDTLYKAIQAEVKKLQSNMSAYQQKLKETQKEQEQLERQISQLINSSSSTGKYSGGLMFWPVPTVRNVSSGFGPRWGSMHRGIDISEGAVPIYGEKIYAAADGVVIYANYTNKWGGGYGYYTIVDHGLDSKGRKISTLYAHTSKLYARVGDKVVGGKTVLGLAGDTGNVTGPHLHFEVRVNGTAVDPIANGYVKKNS